VQSFDLSGVLRRIRRLADLSQRELAERCGLSQSAVAQAESGRRDLAVGALVEAAAVAGLRLAVVDEEDHEVRPMAADTVRDGGSRRFPAHLDTRRSDDRLGLYEPRRDRPETAFTVVRDREARDRARQRNGTPGDHHRRVDGDTPWERKAARRRELLDRSAEERRRRFLAGELRDRPLAFECTCPPRCAELDDWSGRPVHASECPCRCDVG
jgi:transcriptional regulator with XRE-family HTH domain